MKVKTEMRWLYQTLSVKSISSLKMEIAADERRFLKVATSRNEFRL